MSWDSYRHIFEVFDKALARPLVLRFRTKSACTSWRHQAYRARIADRQILKKTEGFSASIYDDLEILRTSDTTLSVGIKAAPEMEIIMEVE